MLILITLVATIVACTVLAFVYLADLWEPEPVDLIQNAFIVGAGAQLVLVLLVTAMTSPPRWSDGWLVITAAMGGVLVVAVVRGNPEVDEAFDHVVYAVAVFAGVGTVVVLYNLPEALAQSPYRDLAGPTVLPDYRDLLLLLGSSGLPAALAEEMMVILAGVAAGVALAGAARRRGGPVPSLVACSGAAAAVAAADWVAGGAWPLRLLVAVCATAWAVALKRGSRHRQRPQAFEEGAARHAAKTVLLVLGTVLLSVVALAALGGRTGLLFEPDHDRLPPTHGMPQLAPREP